MTRATDAIVLFFTAKHVATNAELAQIALIEGTVHIRNGLSSINPDYSNQLEFCNFVAGTPPTEYSNVYPIYVPGGTVTLNPIASGVAPYTPTVSGTAPANDSIGIYVDSVLNITTAANSVGVFSVPLNSSLSAGTHSITASASVVTSPQSVVVTSSGAAAPSMAFNHAANSQYLALGFI